LDKEEVIDQVATDLDYVRYQRYHRRMTDQPFTLPLPPPPPHAGDNIFYVRTGDPEDRTDEDILMRRVPRESAQRFRAAAGARGLTHAQYLAALVELHARLRELADGGDEQAKRELETLGLSTVTT
jgi:hypothetical protein